MRRPIAISGLSDAELGPQGPSVAYLGWALVLGLTVGIFVGTLMLKKG